jgi:DNA invertase Pin-like site-specific DNA recombinase
MATSAIIYTRQSKHRDESISHEIQEQACRQYAASKGYEVKEVFREEGKSGRSTKLRGELRKAMDAVQKGDVLIVWRWSRFSRNKLDSLLLLKEADDKGARVESALEPVDNSAAGKFNRGVLQEMAAFESEMRSESWKEANEMRLAAGKPPSARQYFGYDKDKDTYTINEREAQLLTECYEMYLRGLGGNTIAAWMNEQGAATRRAKHWSVTTIFRMMDNPFPTGYFRWKGELIKGDWEPIISEAVFAAYQKKREAKAKVPARSKSSKWWLQGLVICGLCDGPMTKHEGPRGFPHMRCRTRLHSGEVACKGVRVRVVDIDNAVGLWMGGHVDKWVAQMQSSDERLKAANSLLAEKEHSLRIASEKVTRVLEARVELGMSAEEAAPLLDKARQQKALCEAEYNDALAAIGNFTPSENLYENLTRGTEDMTTDEWKEVVGRLVEKVIVREDKSLEIVAKIGS